MRQRMRLPAAIAAVLAILAGVAASWAAERPAGGSTPLADAVKAFNEKAAEDPIGKDQPPLTVDEVVAAIRAWNRLEVPEFPDQVCDAFTQIAQTRSLPPGAAFESLNGWFPGGDYHFDVWWVRVVVTNRDGRGFSFVIRERMIRSRTVDEELQRVSRLVRERGPERFPGSYRLDEYFESLKKEAAASKRQTERERSLLELERSLQDLKSQIERTRERLRGLEQRLAEREKRSRN